MKEVHRSVSPLRIDIEHFCTKITFLSQRYMVYIQLQILTAECCYGKLSPFILKSHKTQQNRLTAKSAASKWLHCRDSKIFHTPEQSYSRFAVACPSSTVFEPQNYYTFPLIMVFYSTAETLTQTGA